MKKYYKQGCLNFKKLIKIKEFNINQNLIETKNLNKIKGKSKIKSKIIN